MRPSPPRQKGQILVLFAGGVIAFIGLVALALDLSMVYSLQRTERSAADSAALAGAQDLQQQGSRAVTSVQQGNARRHALENLAGRFGVPVPTCDTTANIVDCPLGGTPYVVSIKTPSPSYVNVDPARAVQVTVRHPNVPLTFARVLGQHDWNVAVTSVAGLDFGRSYAIITLRPPKTAGSTFDVKDIRLDGGTIVNVQHGDVGTNSNMDYSGVASGTVMNIDPGYGMYYFDPYFGPLWFPAPPSPPAQTVRQLPTLIADPGYAYPAMSGSLGTAPTWDDARTSIAGPGMAVQRASADAACAAEAAKVDVASYAFMATQPLANIYCYNPGIYESGHGARNATIVVGTGDVALLKPGVYYLKSGLDVSSRIIGGYEPAMPGIALVFDERGPGSGCSSCVFSGNNAVTIALNAGTKFPPGASGIAAKPAIDWDNKPVQTSGASSPTPPLTMTIMVRKDLAPDCYVPTSAPFVEPAGCNAGRNKTINLAGGGSLALEGVQYAPADNVEIHGGSSGFGQVGQIISWTLFYSGGTQINQEGPSSEGQGIIHLDAACSGGTTPCTP